MIDSYNVLTREGPNHTLTTDASMDGWGAVFGTRSTGGLWTAQEAKHHINCLELLAVFLGLQAFCHSLHNTHIRLMIDNTTAVAVINHMGTCHSDNLNTLSKQLWLWCLSRNIWISAAHIARKSNQLADLTVAQKGQSQISLPKHKTISQNTNQFPSHKLVSQNTNRLLKTQINVSKHKSISQNTNQFAKTQTNFSKHKPISRNTNQWTRLLLCNY